MTGQVHLQSKGVAGNYRKALLAVAVSMAMMPLSAHAADQWVATHTQAALLKAAAPVSAASVSTQAQSSGYSLNIKDTPSLGNTSVSALESSQPLNVVVSLKLRNADQLDALLAEINKPGSANYHKYLTPAQFKAQYAPTDAQVQAVVAHLKQSGFSNITVAPNNLLVSAVGNGLGASSAFHVNMKRFNFQGESHFANDATAMVPAALGDTVNSVLGLNDVSKMHTLNQRFTPAAQLQSFTPAAQRKQASIQAAAAGSQVVHQPTDFAQIYNVGTTPAASNTTVGIITWGDMAQTIKDLGAFTTAAGLPTANTLVSQTSTGTYANDPDSNGEWSIDSQTIVGTSGGVKQLIFYATPDANFANITSAYNLAVTKNVAKIINVSLGGNEADTAVSGTQAADDAIFKQAVAQGQIFSVASGDSGAYQGSKSPQGHPGYVGTFNGSVVTPSGNLGTYTVSEPAASPYVIAVGGTALFSNGTTSWAGESTWGSTGGTASLHYCDGKTVDTSVCLGATGGGVSAYEAAPAWQTAALGSSITKRVLPDIAFEGDPASGVNVIANDASAQYGGTSLSAPIFAGLWARIESANNNAIGFPGSNFYQAFSKSANAALLHDVTSGNNGYNGYGYTALPGFDYSTGFGSFDTAQVAAYAKANWVSGGGTTTNVSPVANFGSTTSALTATFTDSSTDSDGSIASRSWNFGDSSTSTATNPSHTYAAAGTYSVSLTVTDNAGATNTKTQSVTVSSGSTDGLQNGVAVTGLSGAKNAQLKYTVNIPAGVSNLTIAITGSTSTSNDADLYLKFGSAPTTSSYDCRPYKPGSNESCAVSNPKAGTYYIMLNGYSAFSGVSLKASWN